VPFDMAPAIGFAGDKNFDWKLISAHPEIVDFGSGQGLSVFATTGIVCLFRGLQKSENAALGQKMLFSDGHYLAMLFPSIPCSNCSIYQICLSLAV
jgi:hypothetical protein